MRRVPRAGQCAALAACLTSLPTLHAQHVTPANSFTDSVGVNVHLASQDSAYEDLPKVRAALKQLRIRHIRDGLLNSNVLEYYTGLKLLAKDGVHSLLYADVSQGTTFFRTFPNRVPGSLEGIEAPNEVDASSNTWLKDTRESQQQITQAVADTQLFTVGPSLTKLPSFAQLGTQPCGCTYGNLHNYFAGHNPGTIGSDETGTGSYGWTVKLAKEAFANLPIMTTESGYTADPSMPNGLPEDIAGKYTVRLLLEQFLHGIQRTYLYELIDMEVPDRGIHDHDGLLRADFSPRPAFTSIAALMALLQDTSTTALTEADAAAQDVVPTPWHLEGGDSSVHRLALRKNNGDTILLLWQEVSGYDVETKKRLPVTPQKVSLSIEGNILPSAMHFAANGALRAVSLHGKQLSFTVDDAPTVIVLPAAQRVLPAPTRHTVIQRHNGTH